jgi:hypothetical protein
MRFGGVTCEGDSLALRSGIITDFFDSPNYALTVETTIEFGWLVFASSVRQLDIYLIHTFGV